MGGGKPKKPLSAMDKERKKQMREIRMRMLKAREERKTAPSLVDEGLMKRAIRTAISMDVVTPATLANALSIKVSTARKIIKQLVSEGKLKLIGYNRGLAIAVPVRTEGSSS